MTDLDDANPIGLGFVVAPDGSRAGVVWESGVRESYVRQLVVPDETHWGIWAVGSRAPLRTAGECRVCLLELVPKLRRRWQAWNAGVEEGAPDQTGGSVGEDAASVPAVADYAQWKRRAAFARTLRDVQIRESLRGYNRDDVNAFLDRAAATAEAGRPTEWLTATEVTFRESLRGYNAHEVDALVDRIRRFDSHEINLSPGTLIGEAGSIVAFSARGVVVRNSRHDVTLVWEDIDSIGDSVIVRPHTTPPRWWVMTIRTHTPIRGLAHEDTPRGWDRIARATSPVKGSANVIYCRATALPLTGTPTSRSSTEDANTDGDEIVGRQNEIVSAIGAAASNQLDRVHFVPPHKIPDLDERGGFRDVFRRRR